MIFMAFFFLIIYMAPGVFMARGLYSEQVREINSKPVQVVPPKPKRPDVTMGEMLHISSCKYLDPRYKACNCRYRDDWVELKNAWLDYQEWLDEYGHIKNGVIKAPEPSVGKALIAVPGWPVVGTIRFITKGAKNIPNYREIERLEMENDMALKELN